MLHIGKSEKIWKGKSDHKEILDFGYNLLVISKTQTTWQGLRLSEDIKF